MTRPTPYRTNDDPRTPPGATRRSLLAFWFGMRAPVHRGAYALSGLGLMLLKYALDAAVVFAATGHVWSPLSYLAPSAIVREQDLGVAAPAPVFALLGLVTLPFLWVGVTMSVRRAADAGLSPWVGFSFLLPALNYVAMIVLATLPTRRAPGGSSEDVPPSSHRIDPGVKRAILAVVVNVVQGLAMTALAVYGFGSYGAALFLVTPCIMGATASFLYNRPESRTLNATLVVALLGTTASGVAILLFAIEGIVCLAMAFPIAAAFACAGAALGWSVITYRGARGRSAALVVLALPGAAGVEAWVARPSLREVETVIEIDAPPEVVWPNVVGFSELPPPPEWFFRLGIAYPMRARIEGEGVGAVRRCEFSTGPFVEPITRWEPPARLSFDVRAQPPSMTEWSLYRTVNAPHLEGYMVSRRGEFRLVGLPGGRTRLEGSTWYTLAIYPEAYWVTYADSLLHGIHHRVLSHIKDLSERRSRAPV